MNPLKTFGQNRTDKFMKFPHLLIRYSSLLTTPVLVSAWSILSAIPLAAQDKPSIPEQLFASPNEAMNALHAAAKVNDQAALHKIFGPDFDQLLTGDAVEDSNNIKRLGVVMLQGCQCMSVAEDHVTLVMGAEKWPFPIPLVKVDGQWQFDTAAGKQEIISRHIGRDELNAIGVSRAYVSAQKRYAGMNPDGNAETKYARHFKSLPGKKDGLYWPAAAGEPASPFGPLVAEAQAEGYVVHAKGTGPHPFFGYYFRILTGQGDAALGGKLDYLTDGNLTKGFALVAWPVEWGQSGIMTFIVNQDGKVYQQDFGDQTSQLARIMKEYNPDSKWTLVQDAGIDGVLLAPSFKHPDDH
jgi:hypothetical protein